MKLKLVVVIDNLIKGGKERRFIELLNGFNISENSIEIVVILLKNVLDYPEIYKIPNVEVKIFEREIKKDPRIFLKLYNICKKFKPDIIHSWGSMPSIYSLPIAKLLGIKFINAMISNAICEVGSKSWIRARLTFPFSDVIVSNSKAGLIAHKAPLKKSKVIPNGFNFDRISKIESQDKTRGRHGIRTKFVVGMIGAFYDRKDFSTLILASNNILKTREDITFILVGDGPNLQNSKQMVDVEFKERIKFLGQQEKVESIINVFDIGVLTTNFKVHREGISNSVLEYMALGKPVIATKGGGTNEIILDGETGFIIEPKNVQQLVSKIDYLINHPHVAYAMGAKGKQRVKESFGIGKMVNTTLELYSSLLKK